MRQFTYKDAGVDIEAAERAVALMSEAVRATHNENVLTGLADFAGMFALGEGWRDPVLVSGTDPVGTKLKIAFALDRHDTVGQDCVAMCVDDIVCQGARPLFFLDHLGVGKLQPHVAAEIVRGVAEACQIAGCALIGGETAELPGFYQEGEYDLVGFATGVVERDEIIDGSAVAAGDVLIGMASSGLHSNGYSLARKVLLEVAELPLEKHIPELGRTLGEELLEPTRIYAPGLVSLQEAGLRPHALVHVTGGGIAGNLARVIPENLTAKVDTSPLSPQPIFGLIAELGNVPTDDMWRTFNMGVGMIAVVGADEADATVSHLSERGHTAQVIGEVRAAWPDAQRVEMG